MNDDDLVRLLRRRAADAPPADNVRRQMEDAISRQRTRNQAATAAGVAVVVSGLVLGVQTVLDPDPGSSRARPAAAPAATSTPASATPTRATSTSPSTSPSPSPSPSLQGSEPPRLEQVFAAYGDAGYDLDDAETLSGLWQVDDMRTVKALAGQQLADGRPLPIAPGQPAPQPDESSLPQDQAALAAFEGAGYDHLDAAELSEAWQEPNLNLVKAVAGQQLMDGVAASW